MAKDAAAIGDLTLAAGERIVSEINDRLQEYESWFHNAWHVAATEGNDD